MVWCVGIGGGTTMNRQEGDVQRVTQMVDTMSGLWCGTHSKINDGALVAHAWDGARDRMEPVNINSARAYPTGLRHHFPKGNIPVPLYLSCVTRIVLELEWPQGSLQLTALGG